MSFICIKKVTKALPQEAARSYGCCMSTEQGWLRGGCGGSAELWDLQPPCCMGGTQPGQDHFNPKQGQSPGELQHGVDGCSPRSAAPPGACRPPAPTTSPRRGSWMWWKSSSLLDARSPSVAEHCINSSSRLPPPFHFCLLNTRSLPFSHSGAHRASSSGRRGLSLTPQEAARSRVPTISPAMEHPPAARILS